MKFLVDFIPIVVFFAVFKWLGIYAATGAAIAAVFIHVFVLLVLRKKVSSLLWANFGLIVIFGGATIYLHNEWFIKIKPTVLYLLLAAVFFISERFFNKNLFKTLAADSVQIGDDVWKFISNSWIIFFVVMAIINLLVAYFTSTETWVNFKLFGFLGATLLFAVFQAVFISRKIGI